MAVNISTAGYHAEIAARQYLHLPFKITKLTTGILSNHLILCLQLGQKEGGEIIDFSLGSL